MIKMTEEKLKNAIIGSVSIAGALKKLEMSVTTANYKSFHKKVKLYNIDTSHLLGQKHLLNQNRNNKTTIPLAQILIEDSTCLSIAQLKIRLIRNGLLKYECYECGITTWRSKKISLQLDHINGIHNDHRIENLRLLCPNCHSQTETFCGKNKKASKNLICVCGNPKHKGSEMCKKCNAKKREKIIWPSQNELQKMVVAKGQSQTARDLGVSPTAVVNRLVRST
jgi:Zn finger protein HypA/HybF involved in hydrogenase expression